MATQDDLKTCANDILKDEMAVQKSESTRLKQTELDQARFMYVASIALVIIYMGFLIYRVVDRHAFDSTSYFLVGLLIFVVATTRRRFTAARSALPPR